MLFNIVNSVSGQPMLLVQALSRVIKLVLWQYCFIIILVWLYHANSDVPKTVYNSTVNGSFLAVTLIL